MRLNLRTMSYDCHIFSWIVEFFSASCTYPEICFFMDRQLFFFASGVAHIKPSFSSWSDGLFCEAHIMSSFSSWVDGLFARRTTIRLFLHGWATDCFFARLVYSRLFLRGLAHLFYLVLSRLIAFFGSFFLYYLLCIIKTFFRYLTFSFVFFHLFNTDVLVRCFRLIASFHFLS